MQGTIILTLKPHREEPRPQGCERFATASWSHHQVVGFLAGCFREFANGGLAKSINVRVRRNSDSAFSNLSSRPGLEQVHP